jgi:hypothetical protein
VFYHAAGARRFDGDLGQIPKYVTVSANNCPKLDVVARRGGTTRSSPGTECLEASPEGNRPVGYGMIGHSYVMCSPCFLGKAKYSLQSSIGLHDCANQTVPSGTALLGWRYPRHSVPGYDRIVPPGHFRTVKLWELGVLTAILAKYPNTSPYLRIIVRS